MIGKCNKPGGGICKTHQRFCDVELHRLKGKYFLNTEECPECKWEKEGMRRRAEEPLRKQMEMKRRETVSAVQSASRNKGANPMNAKKNPRK